MRLPRSAWTVISRLVRWGALVSSWLLMYPLVRAAWMAFLDPWAAVLSRWSDIAQATGVFTVIMSLAGLAFGFAQALSVRPVRPNRPRVLRAGASLSLGAIWLLMVALVKLAFLPSAAVDVWAHSGGLGWARVFVAYALMAVPFLGSCWFTARGFFGLQIGLLSLLLPIAPDWYFRVGLSEQTVPPRQEDHPGEHGREHRPE